MRFGKVFFFLNFLSIEWHVNIQIFLNGRYHLSDWGVRRKSLYQKAAASLSLCLTENFLADAFAFL